MKYVSQNQTEWTKWSQDCCTNVIAFPLALLLLELFLEFSSRLSLVRAC